MIKKEQISSYIGSIPNSFSELFSDKFKLSDFLNSSHDDTFLLGKKSTEDVVTDRLSETGHILISGMSGSGKTSFLNNTISSFLLNSSHTDLQLILIDLKYAEFFMYSGIVNLYNKGNIVSDFTGAMTALDYVINEIKSRSTLMEKVSTKSLEEYNNSELVKSGKLNKLSKIVLIIDEFGDLVIRNKKLFEEKIRIIGQNGESSGIFMILSTQIATKKILTDNIVSNFPTRISFRQQSPLDSMCILGENGAECLDKVGLMLYKKNGSNTVEKIQSGYICSSDLNNIIRLYKENNNQLCIYKKLEM